MRYMLNKHILGRVSRGDTEDVRARYQRRNRWCWVKRFPERKQQGSIRL